VGLQRSLRQSTFPRKERRSPGKPTTRAREVLASSAQITATPSPSLGNSLLASATSNNSPLYTEGNPESPGTRITSYITASTNADPTMRTTWTEASSRELFLSLDLTCVASIAW
jgi:hypothetical protein